MYSGKTPSKITEATSKTTFCGSPNRWYDDVVVASTYSRIPNAALNAKAPIQSMSSTNRVVHFFSDSRYTLGNDQIAATAITELIIALTKKLHRQPIVSVKIPPSNKPTEKPSGWPMPMVANATFRQFPLAKVLVTRLTAVGRHIDTAMPNNVRKRMISTPVLDNPTATVKPT